MSESWDTGSSANVSLLECLWLYLVFLSFTQLWLREVMKLVWAVVFERKQTKNFRYTCAVMCGVSLILSGFVIVVVRLSKTTKNRHGQPNMNLWNTLVVRTDNQAHSRNNFATEHADIRRTVIPGPRQSSVISETELTLIMSAVMCVWLLTMPCGRNTVFKF